MIPRAFLVVVTSCIAVSGCINSGILVKVKPDGSGTIEQTTLVNAATVGAFTAQLGGQQQGKPQELPGVLTDAEFKRTAERIGARPVSLTPLEENGWKGSKAVFAFDDITKVRVDQDPQMSGSPGAGLSTSKSTPIKFAFARQGGNSVLTITVDETTSAPGEKPSAPATNQKMDPAMLQIMKTMFQGFKVAVDLELEGKIVKTNADYVNGSRITMLEIDMAQLLENEAALTALQGKVGPGATLAEVRPLLKDVKGVKINNSTVTVEFR